MQLKKIKIGTPVRFNKAFLATLNNHDRANERRRKYTVTAIRRPFTDGTVIVDLATPRTTTSTTIDWLEAIES